MGADSATNVYDRPIIDGARKLRRLQVGAADCLIGCCGAGGMADVIGYRLGEMLPTDVDDIDRWAAGVAWAANALCIEVGLTEGGRQDGSLLLGYAGRLWVLSEVQAIRIPDGVCALGSGEGPAMGVLDVLLEQGSDPGCAVEKAVEIAIHRDRHSQGPVYLEHLRARA
jgi:ATP-dependent protease HslVU (ClpYQ) peptidase subunit